VDIEAAVRSADLDGALAAAQDRVRADPTAPAPRILLFQLLAVLGQWDRALLQLKALAELDASLLPLAWTYRSAIQAERIRDKVFRGEAVPPVLGEPAQWTALLLEALKYTATGRTEEGAALRRQAFEAAPATPGRIDGQPFSWIADADSRIGPMLELVVQGRYVWAPFERVSALTIEPPTDLRDLVWTPVHVVWVNEGETEALLPARYVGTEHLEDRALALSRKTVWEPCGEQCYLGYGQRMWVTDRDEYPVLDAREIRLETAGA